MTGSNAHQGHRYRATLLHTHLQPAEVYSAIYGTEGELNNLLKLKLKDLNFWPATCRNILSMIDQV